ncbi:MAG: hypothetical protein FJX20_16365 [Alphaproteobacteria bacterium]|nr:hypothetical protein [Alphaproteobacteria bacterium]
MSDVSSRPARNAFVPISARQVAVLIGLGAGLWFLAAMILRLVAPMGALDGAARALTYALVIPGTLPAVWLIWKLPGLRRDQVALGGAIATATAALLDGVALAWFPDLYAADVRLVAACGAAILWGAGVGLVLTLLFNRVPGR